MKLVFCHIENFGCLHDRDYRLTDGLNEFCEENGRGKSTFASFIGAMFYGMQDGRSNQDFDKRPRERYQPWQGGKYGGYILVESGGKIFRIERFFSLKSREDTLTVYDEETGMEIGGLNAETLGEHFFGIDREGYKNSAFIGQNRLASSVNDSLRAKMSGITEAEGDLDCCDRAISLVEAARKDIRNKRGGGRMQQYKRGSRRSIAC